MTLFRVSFGGNNRQRAIENAPLKARAKEAKLKLLDVGLEGLDDIDRELVLFDYLADGLDERARERTPSLVVRIGPWILGGSSGGAVVALVQGIFQ